ncbi:MAG: portal protein [Pseudomonadota bacterium]
MQQKTTGNEPIKTRDDDSKESILKEARDRAQRAYTYWSPIFSEMRAELAFLYGAQWPREAIDARQAANRPCLTINNLPAHLDQVQGDQRMTTPGIQISPADHQNVSVYPEADETSQGEPIQPEPIPMAEMFEGLIRNIEYRSNAERHYDMAFQHEIECGLGWLRVLCDYEDDASFDQDAFIKSIPDRFSVLIDPDCKEPDYADADYCFISETVPRLEFEARYPDAMGGSLVTEATNWWGDRDNVTVTEYYRREPMTRELIMLSDGTTTFRDALKMKGEDGAKVDVLEEMEAAGITVVKRRKVKTFKVLWSKITSQDVLEKERPVPGRMIPVAPVLGKVYEIDGQRKYRGLTRFARDAKQMHNLMLSAATERIAMAPKAPYLGTVENFAGHEHLWERSNLDNKAYLPYNYDPEQGVVPQRQDTSLMPVGEVNMAMAMNDMVKATIGQHDASLGAQGNETSGKAITARQREGDVGAFAYQDNLHMAIAKCGRCLVETIPTIYDTQRVARIRHLDGSTARVTLNKTIVDADTGDEVLVNDITVGRFDVIVKAGPSFTTQREEAVTALLEFVRVAPNTAPALLDVLARNMDWPGAQQIAKRLKAMVPPHVLTERERQEMPKQEPTPEQQAMAAKAEADVAGADADKAMAQAKIAEAEAKTVEAQAKIAEIEAMGTGDHFIEKVKQIVAEALAEVAAGAQQPKETDNE